MKKRLFVDMDGVMCVFNKEASIEEVASPGYFRYVTPQINVIAMIIDICKDHSDEIEVYSLSSVFFDGHSIPDKNIWMDSHRIGDYIPKERRFFVPYAMTKSEFIRERFGIREDDFLLDDFTKNLAEWHGVGIKLYNGYNGTKGTWNGYSISLKTGCVVMKNTLLGIMKYAVA